MNYKVKQIDLEMCIEDEKFWGKEIVIDASDCISMGLIQDRGIIERFFEAVVPAIDMIPFGEPIIKWFGSGDARGYTAIQLIETSNITIHFAENTHSMYFNLFSCKDFNQETVTSLINLFFDCKMINMIVIRRGI